MFSFLSDVVLTEVMVYEDMVSAVDPALVAVHQKTRDRWNDDLSVYYDILGLFEQSTLIRVNFFVVISNKFKI